MYCQNCGARVSGNFCSSCGSKIVTPAERVEILEPTVPDENIYQQLLKNPEVRNLIAKYAQKSPHKLSAQDFLKLADLAFKPIPGLSLSKIGETAVPILIKLGFKTGKSVKKELSEPTTSVVVKVFCSLAKNGFELKTVEQATNGLIVHAEIASDLWTWGGDLLISIEEFNAGTKISIDVKIRGQIYDWGKSKAIIAKITEDIDTITV